ncbi:MAG: MqnA/MqnD/SBP family protein [Acholeplasmataceae bacterium]
MKKRLCFLLLCLMMIFVSACQKDLEANQVTMMVPYGSTQLAQLYLENDDYYNVDIISGPDLLVSAFSAQTHDVIIAPMNLGAKLYLNQPNYLCLGVIVWGNFYIISHTQNFESFEDLDGKTITMFGQNQTADIILSYLMDAYDIHMTRTYVDGLMTAQAMLLSDQTDIILTAEPSLSVLTEALDLTSILDIQAAYQEISGTTSYPQAGIFVHHRLAKDAIIKLQNDFINSIRSLTDDPLEAARLAQDLGFDLELNVLVQAIERSHLSYVHAQDAKEAIEDYFDIIIQVNPNLIGPTKPDDGFYHQP